MGLLVTQAALALTVQDSGRSGYQRFGLPESGPMDWWAHRAANLLVGNAPGAACLELGFSDAVLRVESEMLFAVCGAGYRLRLNGRELPLWMAFRAREADEMRLEKTPGGNWVYLAAAGDLLTPAWFGSQSVYPRGGMGRPITAGDQVPTARKEGIGWQLAGQSLPKAFHPPCQAENVIRVVPGPHEDRFTPASVEAFYRSPFTVSTRSDRMGYRLRGPVMVHHGGADLVSQGMVIGEIQVPGDGQPIVMMPDHPTTGGYTCIATVIRADLPLVAQSEPGVSEIRFAPVEVSAAQEIYRNALAGIDSGIQPKEDLWHQL